MVTMGLKTFSGKNKLFLKGLLFFVFVFILFNVSFSFDSNNISPISEVSAQGFDTNFSSKGPPDSGMGSHAAVKPDYDWFTAAIMLAVNAVLIGILSLLTYLLGAAGFLFDYVLNPANFTTLMNMPALYTTWAMVRDLLNILFILFLLFSAFATIFQVEKYSTKKILLTLVIMALLVNFSFPIARFIIDLANVPMYYLLDSSFGGSTSSAADLLKNTGIDALMSPEGSRDQTMQLLMSIVFVFIMALTMIVLAFMFLIRLVVLALLVVFSSAGFIAAAFPATKKYADMWWTNLFKYAFFGPIMAFMLLVSTQFVKNINESITIKSAVNSVAANSVGNSGNATDIAKIVYFVLPIIILWAGMIVANKMGLAGASVVVGKASSFAKGAGRKFNGANWAASRYGAYQTERKRRADTKLAAGNTGKTIGRKLNTAQDKAHGKLMVGGGDKWYKRMPGAKKANERIDKANKAQNREDIEKKEKEITDSGATSGSLASDISKAIKDPAEKKKEKIEQAATAIAYLKKPADDRKVEIQNSITASVNAGGQGISGTNLESAFNTLPSASNEKAALIDAVQTIGAAGAGDNVESELRRISAFVSKQADQVIKKGTEA